MEFPYTELRREHSDLVELVLCVQDKLMRRAPSEAGEVLWKFVDLAEAHFLKENENLFIKAFGHSRLQNGGPFCTYYFGLFIDNRPLARVEKLMRMQQPGFSAPALAEWEQKYVSEGSALAIPVEDHHAIRTLAKQMRLHLQSEDEISWRWLEKAAILLQEILKTNHEKEEHCLFPHIAQLLSA